MRKPVRRPTFYALHRKAEQALREAVAGVIQDRLRTGDPVVIWQDGKVAFVPAKHLLARKHHTKGRSTR